MTFFGPDIRNGLPISLGSMAGFGRRAFTPSVLFAAGEQGFWYDPSDLSSMYQDSAGTTPVTAVEQAVGLILDKSKGLVLGANAVPSLDLTAAGWSTLGTLSAFTANTITNASGSPAGRANNDILAPNTWYQVQVSFTQTAAVAFSVRVEASGVDIVSSSALSGTLTGIGFSGATDQLYFRLGGSSTVTITSVSLRPLAGNHAIQPGATNRPILRSRYNQFTFSEDITNAAWTKSGITVTGNAGVAPDGTTTADRMTAGSVGYYLQTTGTLNGTNMPVTATIRIKNESYTASDTLYINISDGVTGYMQITFKPFDGTFTTPAPAASWSNVTRTVTDIGGGYWLLTLQGTTTQWGSGWMEVGVTAAHNRSCLVWGHDLRRQCDTYLPYQRIGASTDYDTVGFPVYLSFDGSDDSLYTGGNVDFSATDKMTVFAGVTKLSDAAAAPIIEFGPDSGANNGVFAIFAPSGGGVADYYWRSKGTVASNNSVTGNASPSTRVLTAIGDIAADFANLRVDGVDNTKSDDQGTGNFASAVVNIGRRNNASAPFNGRLYQLIGRGAATSAALITQADRWVAGKQGRTL